MKNILNKMLSPQLFAACYLPYLTLNLMTVVNILSITRIFLIFFAAWGVAICIKTFLFSGKGIYFEKYMALLIGFLAVCFITQVINLRYGGVGVIGRLAYFALCILVLYSQYKSTVDDYKKTLLYATRTMSVIITAAMIASLIMFFNLYTGRIAIRSGGEIYLGVAENRLYGVFSSPNVGGMYALILIWCALVNLHYLKKSKLKPLWICINIFEILVALAYISVALSRGTYLAGAAFLVAFLIVRVPFAFEKRLNVWLQGIIRVVSVALCLAVAIGAFSVLRTGCVKVAEAVSYSKEQQKPTEPTEPAPPRPQEPTEPAEPDETDKMLDDLNNGFEGRVESNSEKKDITNKRKDIWTAHLSILKGKNLILGVNEPYEYYKLEKEAGREFTHHQFIFIEWAKGNLHNGYLQILVHCGIVAFGIFVLFVIICAVKSVVYLCKSGSADYEKYKLFSLALPMVVNILANNVVESNMALMGANYFQALFWFVAGLTVFCVYTKKEKK